MSAQGWSLPLRPEVGETSGELGKTSGVKQTQAAGHRDELLQLVATRVSRSLTVSFPSLGYNNARESQGTNDSHVAPWIPRSLGLGTFQRLGLVWREITGV